MNFEQLKAKLLMLTVWDELDQLPSTLNGKFTKQEVFQDEINKLKNEFGIKELEGIKILAKFI